MADAQASLPPGGVVKAIYFMKFGERALASIDLVHGRDILPEEGWIITRVLVPKELRRQGIGTLLMQEVLLDADQQGISLYLEINPYGDGGPDYNQLEAWYKKLGFVETSGYYYRLPEEVTDGNNGCPQKNQGGKDAGDSSCGPSSQP